jgi:NAD(P)H-dependent flavin oxidoreductase YrpB (nitropropane dioxygenase family)
MYRNRRLGVVAFLAGVLGAALIAMVFLGYGEAKAANRAINEAINTAANADTDVSNSPTVVVHRGDTLWSIARLLHPNGDVRSTVVRLSHARQNTGPLLVGERIPLWK